MKNLETLQKLSLGTDDTQTVIIEYEGEKNEFNMRPLTSGELSRLQVIEKKPLVVKVGMNNGRRQAIKSNVSDVDINTGEFTQAQSDAMYTAIAWSLSIDDEVINPDDIKGMRAGLPELLFEEVINVSKLSDNDLTSIKTFRKNE